MEMNYLLLGALGRTTKNWEDFADHLKKAKPTAAVHFLDLPGFGDASETASPLSIDQTTDEVRAKWLLLKKEKAWTLVCISLGGMVALNWLGRYPEDFIAGVLVNTSTSHINRLDHRFRPSARRQLYEIFKTNNASEREIKILKLTSHKFPEEILKKRTERATTSPRINSLRQLIAAAFFKPPKLILTPLLFLAGENDQLVNPVCTRELAHYYSSTFFIHPTAGHEVQVDDPSWLAEKITQFS